MEEGGGCKKFPHLKKKRGGGAKSFTLSSGGGGGAKRFKSAISHFVAPHPVINDQSLAYRSFVIY